MRSNQGNVRRELGALTLTALLGCVGELEFVPGTPLEPAGGRVGGAPGAHGDPAGQEAPAAVDATVGLTGYARLNNAEYDNTVRDLLGTRLTLARTFVAEEEAGFDNVAAALGMTPSQYESYFNAGEALARELFADSARRNRVLPCTPLESERDGGACLGQQLAAFGTRAYRRPLRPREIGLLRETYGRARTAGESPAGALEHVLASMLASAPFLYRADLAADAPLSAIVPLDGYALASRLSYFLWSTLPDDELFRVAADRSLVETDVLRAQLTRMLDHPAASALIDQFAAQWLGLRELAQHKVDSAKFPGFDEALRQSMLAEARAFFGEFLRGKRPLDDFLRAPLHFVDARLATHYGIAKPASGMVAITDDLDGRRGFLGLASFLTLSSFAHRTSPTLRAKWVLEELLCSRVPDPPPNVGELEDGTAANAAAAIENVRARLALHRSAPSCAGCHASLDPIGLGLERFDAIGARRDKYENGDAIETSGKLPDGRSFAGSAELASLLADDPRFLSCVSEKMLTYALGRKVDDQASIDAVVRELDPERATLRDLITTIVLSGPFRSARAKEQP